MSNNEFTAGYLAGAERRTSTDEDRDADGDWSPGDGYLRCPIAHAEPTPDCDWCAGFAAAWE
ncbi:hypothetical protein [Mycobacterium aquaticum]|uniref:hypothetical protein n=1 Tax=Mycobacterium aquaticum TaxID=1927124 RepID=UPI0011547CED|nr:hypothetical protein [Mycobacterium aquaticum]